MNIKSILSCYFLLACALVAFSEDLTRDLKLATPRMNGNDVAALQSRLVELGFASIGTADGWFGPLTDKAVRSYQELIGFEKDGVVGKQLWEVLFSERGAPGQLNSDIKAINSFTIAKYTKKQTDVFGRSAEGGSLTQYFDNKELKYAEVDLYGESGKVYNKVYFVGDRSLVVQTYYHYPAPFDVEHAEVEISTFYYQGKSTYELREGSLSKAEYDRSGVMDIIVKGK